MKSIQSSKVKNEAKKPEGLELKPTKNDSNPPN